MTRLEQIKGYSAEEMAAFILKIAGGCDRCPLTADCSEIPGVLCEDAIAEYLTEGDVDDDQR